MRKFPYLPASLALALSVVAAHGITIVGYDSDTHDRFSSGFPSNPVQNTHSSFIGLDYDWSGVGWSTTTYDSGTYKGLGMLSPLHFLTAQHYENTNGGGSDLTQGVRILDQNGTVQTRSRDTITNTGLGIELTFRGHTAKDISIGTLTASIADPTTFARYAVLDLHNSSSSNTLANYANLDLFLYGRPSSGGGGTHCIASTPVDQVGALEGDPDQLVILTDQSDAAFQSGDSAAPATHGWTNPNGDAQLTVLGVNSARGTDLNVISFLASTAGIAATNDVLTPAGFALRIDGNVTMTWEGGSGSPAQRTHLNRTENWSGTVAADTYAGFEGDETSFRDIDVNDDLNLRGLYFLDTGASNLGFTFGGSSTLTLGRGGITNYDESRQTFTAPLALGAHQYWEVGQGGVTANNINTNGNLLEIAGAGTAIINGALSGSGGLALSGSRLELNGTSTYTGNTWVHTGRLVVEGSIATSSGVLIGTWGSLSGTGTVSTISGSGSVHPGNSPGILTAEAVDPSGSLDFFFEFTQTGSPNFGQPNASGNDLLRLTGGTPFINPLTGSNDIFLFFDLATELAIHDVFRGGFFTDNGENFNQDILDANFLFLVSDPGGSFDYDGTAYALYSGPLLFQIGTVAQTANFGNGDVDGFIMEITVIPEPATVAFLIGLLALLGAVRSARRAGRARRCS